MENDKQITSSIFESGFVSVYDDEDGKWKILKRFGNKVCNAKGIAAVRTAVEDTVKQLDYVKMVVASEIPGIAFGAFQAAGFDIFLVENNTLDILDPVKKEMLELEKKRKEKPREFDIMQFLEQEMNKGDFSLNMEEILLKNPDLTSKKILIPYLKNGDFTRLDVICSHIPKWFYTDLSVLGFEYEIVNELPNKKTIRIVHVKKESSGMFRRL